MTISTTNHTRSIRGADLRAAAVALGPHLAQHDAQHDAEGSFVHEAYALLGSSGYLAAPVPVELQGGGATTEQVAWAQYELARSCGSSALATTMHLHVVLTTAWRWRRGLPGAEALLRRVAEEGLVLASTGGGDFAIPTGEARRVDGGWEVTGRKSFVSGAPVAGVAATWAVTDDGEAIAFGVSLRDPAVTVVENWDAPGMRGTASHDVLLDRPVAMKVMLGQRIRPRDRARFLREAKVLARLEHPNIVPIHDLALDADGQPFYTMKLVQGVTLKDVINDLKTGDAETVAKYPLNQLLTIFQKVCDAVAFAHSKGVVHRDLKPENIMLGEYGEVLVLDWGLAKILDMPEGRATQGPEQAQPEEDSHSSSLPLDEGIHELEQTPGGDSALTMEGHVMGTPQFMAPEQAAGEIHKIDQRTDVFSLGGILYSLLSLRPPTGGSTVREVLENMKSGLLAPPVTYNRNRRRAADGGELEAPIDLAHCPGQRIPDALSAVCMKALATEREERYQTVAELQQDVIAYQGGFATDAEGAGAFRQMWLLVKRHKTTFALTAAGLLLTGAVSALLTAKIVRLSNKAEGVLTDLKKTIPLQRAEIQTLIDAQQFDQAMEKIEALLKIDPATVDWHLLKGNLLQSQLKLPLAQASYKLALELDSSNQAALDNLRLCDELIRSMSGKPTPPAKDLERFQKALIGQKRQAESLVIAKMVGKVSRETLEYWRAELDKKGVQGKLELDSGGMLSLDLQTQKIPDLTPLKGIPLGRLNIGLNEFIYDLNALQGMPLRDLSIQDCKVNDFSPLKGMALTNLFFNTRGEPNRPALRDLSPLSGMPLQSIIIYYTGADDLTPLKGMPLTHLAIYGGPKVSDLIPLRGLPLTSLYLYNSQISDLSPLEGMRLQVLQLGGNKKISDLTPLKNMPLGDLRLEGCSVKDISALAGMPLGVLGLSRNPLTNISVTVDMPLTEIFLDGCTNLTDISPLVECKKLQMVLLPSTARNAELLRDHPKLKQIAYAPPHSGNFADMPSAAEFWKAHDAQKGKRKK